MESMHGTVGDERAASQQAPLMIAQEGMFEALGGEGDEMLGPGAAGVCCGHAGDSDSDR